MGKILVGIAMASYGQEKVEKNWVKLGQRRSNSK
jgi:hypothetical protein